MQLLILSLFPFLVVIAYALCTPSKPKLPSGSKLPPGPPGKPFVGNLPDIPPAHSWLKFKEWADKYGPLFRLKLMGRNMIVVSTEKIANDLLRERGTIYSSREQLPMAAQLMSQNLRLLFIPYGDLFRRLRKLMHVLTMQSVAASYEPVQMHESERLLYGFLNDPSKYEELFELYAGGLIMKIAYDKSVESTKDPDVRRALQVVHTVERVASPGAYLVDSFPLLNYLPKWLAPFKREAEMLHQREKSFYRELLYGVRDRIRSEKCGDCFARKFLENQDQFDLSDDEGAYALGILFEAGSGTTAAAMMSFCLAMCHYPDWQSKMQREVDEVVGSSRMPTFDDIPSLPTVRAVAKEALRWRPVTAGGIPHELNKDDVYEGFFFPAGTNILPNQWAIHREEKLYPDPETFNPERWLSADYPTFREPLTKFPNLQNFSAFGFGRRICPGMNIAEKSLHLLTARMAWAFTLKKRPGVEVPLYDYTSGFNVQPKPFVFDSEVRSPEKRDLIQKKWKESMGRGPVSS
ncbi:cytochrome P450 [Leptodontidium sp. MPI-SDFR-AT-0119]|nr:cytochrome P450 [Leptodontidium sp. MPI-SDFR-AT-0119]